MSVLQDYLKGTLWKKQLIASFVEQVKLSIENMRCIGFQFQVAKLSQYKCIMLGVYYTGLCTIDTLFFAMLANMQGGVWKKQLITSFVKHLTECHENTICIDFQFHNPKLIQEGCFETYI